jgi:hypothetical protein
MPPTENGEIEMSKNRNTTGAPSPKGARSQHRTKAAPPKKTAAPAKKTAGSRRYEERQERKHQAALDARRARNRRWAVVSIGLVVILVATLVIVKVAGGGGGSGGTDQASPPSGTPIPAATLSKLASVPLSTLAAAPTGGITSQISPITQAQPASGSRGLATNGKPELLYIGAEFCPHCAAQRWALYVALSKFGTFSPAPGRIHSATQDGNVPTLTFYGTTYSSPYFAFTPVEVYTNKPAASGGYTPLQTPTASQSSLWQHLGGGSFPFLDFGGKATLVGAQYSYVPMQNLAFADVAAQVGNNATQIGANIDAGAYQLVKSICGSLSSGKPASVCSAAGA